MPRLGRKALCPCGTGRRYEDCCLERNIIWRVDEKGKPFRTAKLSREAMEAFQTLKEKQNVEFKKIFGRDLAEEDYIFFQDRYLGSSGDMIDRIVNLMKKVDLPPEKIYATKKTGLIPSAENLDKMTTKDIEDWEDAIDEYYERLEKGESPLDDEEPHPVKEIQNMLELLPNCLMLMAHVRNNLKTPIKDPTDVVSVSSVSLIQFCLSKSEMNMKAIAKLIDDPNHRAEALDLTRSL